MAIIKVPAKLVEEIKYLKEDDVYDGEIEGICSAFTWVTGKMLDCFPKEDLEDYNKAYSCLSSFRSLRNLVDLLVKAEIIED